MLSSYVNALKTARILGYIGSIAGFLLGLLFTIFLFFISNTSGLFGEKQLSSTAITIIGSTLFFFLLSIIALFTLGVLNSNSKGQKILILVCGILQVLPLFLVRLILRGLSEPPLDMPLTIKIAWISPIFLIMAGILLIMSEKKVQKNILYPDEDFRR